MNELSVHKAINVSDHEIPEASGGLNPAQILTALRRRKKTIVRSALVVFGLGIAYVLQAVPQYTSSAAVMIDNKQVGVAAVTPADGAIAFDTGMVDSQVLLLSSDRLANAVIDHLDLLHNKNFINPPKSLFGAALSGVINGISAVVGLFSSSPSLTFENTPVDIQRNLLAEQLQKNLKVARSARSYVLTIDYTDPDPAFARLVAQTYAEAYLRDQLSARAETSQRAATWLEEQVRDVKKKADDLNRQVETYRTKHKLTEASGRLINEQALSDANTQLSIARNDLTSAQAKEIRLKQIIDDKDYMASNVDALSSPIISNLRSRYLDALKMKDDITHRLGANHEAAQRATKDMALYSNLIFQELSRLLESYQSEVNVAAERVRKLEQTIESIRGATDVDANAMTTLKTLEQESATYTNIYNLYLQKAQDLVQQLSIPVSDARIIGDAQFPIRASSPKKLLIIPGSLILGALIGVGIALYRERKDHSFRTARQMRDELRLDFVSYLPLLPSDAFAQRHDGALVEAPAGRGPYALQRVDKANFIALDEPMSQYVEALRSIKIAFDYRIGSVRPLVIGFISTLAEEGKSTTAKNFATLLSLQGEKVLLLDGDLRNPQLSKRLAPNAPRGLVDLLRNPGLALDDALYVESDTGLHFLPAVAASDPSGPADLLASPAMGALIERLRQSYSVIIADFAPLGPVKDAAAAARFVDYYHLIVEWGATSRSAVADFLTCEPSIAERLVSASLSKVDFEALPAYDSNVAHEAISKYLASVYPAGAPKPAKKLSLGALASRARRS